MIWQPLRLPVLSNIFVGSESPCTGGKMVGSGRTEGQRSGRVGVEMLKWACEGTKIVRAAGINRREAGGDGARRRRIRRRIGRIPRPNALYVVSDVFVARLARARRLHNAGVSRLYPPPCSSGRQPCLSRCPSGMGRSTSSTRRSRASGATSSWTLCRC